MAAWLRTIMSSTADKTYDTMANSKTLGGIASILKTDTEFLIKYTTGELAKLNILNSHVFKYYMCPSGNFLDYPTPNNPEDDAKITIKDVSDYDPTPFQYAILTETDVYYNVYTNNIAIQFDKKQGTMTIHDSRSNKDVLKEALPLCYADKKIRQTLRQSNDEYFFGGGMQNGRFSHKGEEILIVNTNHWDDGGVTSPCPFYWSTYGYGVLRNTWQPGVYDFGTQNNDIVTTTHNGEDFDAFFFISSNPKAILKDYYELTGQPTFMPEYAFYEAHLNAFNRDYWVKVDAQTHRAILFEDGYYYKCYQPNDMDGKVGILESLNGEKNNYQFSARAMIDRYVKHDMPLGWFIPNDGYGCGYGQTDSLDGDIENLRMFAEYARKNGVQCALWTESKLEPEDSSHPKKGERDLRKEVAVADVVALKCDVAWIGYGYSFGLSAVEKAAKIFTKAASNKTRTMIIMVDGWAGTQRHAGIWSGDQTGGKWEYIRFHIPTYIGSGLSGIPIVGSDMDGIYGGKGRDVNVRDYQWKAFTPLQLNMDGWGNKQKSPFTFDDNAKTINRAYLKLKAMLMPYNYTIGYESIHSLPMIRAMFLEFPHETCAHTKDSQYQFMWGPSLLIAPVYKGQDKSTEWVRNGVYLPNPDQVWTDFFTGEKYQGGKIVNNLNTPLWKIPVFVKDGAIIPLANANNNPSEIKKDIRTLLLYANGETHFEVYEDDGCSSDYLTGGYAKTKITMIGPKSNESGNLHINIRKTVGDYKDMMKNKITILKIMASKPVEHIKAVINNEPIHFTKVDSEDEFNTLDNVYYYSKNFTTNPYLREFGGDILSQGCLMIKIHKTDVTESDIHIKLNDFDNISKVFGSNNSLNTSLHAPTGFTVLDDEITLTDITLRWSPSENVYYEIERDGVIFTNILNEKFTFEGFKHESEHKFRIRSANDQGVSKWSYYIVVSTKENPHKHIIKDPKILCNINCQPCQEVCNLVDGKASSLWHTDWGKPGQANKRQNKSITLRFDLGGEYKIDKFEYTPRDDAGNGTILELEYRFSVDGKIWSDWIGSFIWERNEKAKVVDTQGDYMKFVELKILDSVGGFGSGKHIWFYKKVD